jgi:hypothetical protein
MLAVTVVKPRLDPSPSLGIPPALMIYSLRLLRGSVGAVTES